MGLNKEYNTLLCCIGKNENKYIREYIEWYKNIGVSHIRLYDNNDMDGEHFEDIIGDYIQDGFVEIIDYRGKKICQLEAYNNCYEECGENYDWLMFFDCDEFLELNEYKSINEYLSEDFIKEYDMIHINWLTFGDNNKLYYENIPITQRFTTPIKIDTNIAYDFPENCHIKSIIRGRLSNIRFTETPHTPYLCEMNCCNNAGEKVRAEFPFARLNYDKIFLRHYTTKTIDEYCNKLTRGFADQILKNDNIKILLESRFFRTNEITKEKIEIIKNKLNIDMSYLLPHKYEGKKNDDVKIYSLCYSRKNFKFIDDSVVTPLQVGSDLSKTDVCELKDNTGDNISSKNYFYIENTGTYWIWKNVKNAKYKGQMQYRRPISSVNETMDFDNIFSIYDVITCTPFNHPENSVPTKEKPMYIPAQTVEEGYSFSNCKDDILILEMIINMYYPEYKESYKKYIKEGENLYYSNGFILKSEDYDRYCEFLFDCLEKYQNFVDVSTEQKLYERVRYNMEVGKYPKHLSKETQTASAIRWQMSIGGFLSERIWTLWLLHNFKEEKILKLPYIKMEEGMYT